MPGNYGWGQCSRCKTPLGSMLQRGLCAKCGAQDRKRQVIDAAAEVNKLLQHPDLAEVDDHMQDWYPT